jgi:serine/threonine protein kinase HipA of HipAB toxin-antitoxin module
MIETQQTEAAYLAALKEIEFLTHIRPRGAAQQRRLDALTDFVMEYEDHRPVPYTGDDDTIFDEELSGEAVLA